MIYGARDILRNPKLLRIDSRESFIIEDKRVHKRLGIYMGVDLAGEFLEYQRKDKLLKSARNIKLDAQKECKILEDTIDDGL